jgi:hypothetical protein
MSDIPANDFSPRLAVLEEIARGTKSALDRIERRFDAIDRRFDTIDRRFDTVDRRFDTVDRRLIDVAREQATNFRFTITLLIGWGVALLGVMAHGFHWV